MTFRGRVAAVSYLNTVPFIYGIEHAHLLHADLLLAPPAVNAAAFADAKADIALVPIGSLPSLGDARIITSYCIGAHNPVRTVVLVSDSPMEEIRRVWLDGHSRTSALLVKILCHELWNITPQWFPLDDYSVVDQPAPGDAFLLIGDKVFDYEGRFRYTQDLAECWQTMTRLPFVFAVWIARSYVPQQTIDALDRSLAYGVEHIAEAVAYYGHSGKPYAVDYLTNNIDFLFDAQKRKALALYWEKGQRFLPLMNPG